ncbi:glycosyltransferase [Massilia oculi]|uniref:glycosyltransferase n=1 Tax=Massilia oculi TaxID=945844 RepID=UPI0028A7A424|nr:glycosyltransferase [Massilia oculi]
MTGRMRIACISTMFPNPRMPVHAQFVKQRLDALSGKVELIVISPIPWFPGDRYFRRYANRSRIPPHILDNAYPTHFPRFLSIPAILKPLDGVFLAFSVWKFIVSHRLADKIDLLDCHLAFPEGFAGALLSRALGKPYVVTLRGHDINELHRFPVRGRQVRFALRRCARYFGVARALVDGAIRLGAPAEKGYASTNGVDTARFRPTAKEEARGMLGLESGKRYLLSVSHLVPRKGVDILLRALALLRAAGHTELRLIVVGKGGEEGDCEADLRALAGELGIAGHVVWAGAVANTDLYLWYSAADVFCLASEKEGWPNVILEAMACATPVVAHRTWGVPEIITGPDLGMLVETRAPEAFSEAIGLALARTWDVERLRGHARDHTWDEVAEGLLEHFQVIVRS